MHRRWFSRFFCRGRGWRLHRRRLRKLHSHNGRRWCFPLFLHQCFERSPLFCEFGAARRESCEVLRLLLLRLLLSRLLLLRLL